MPPQSGASVVKPGVPRLFTWEEVSLRTGQGDFKEERWLVIDRKVYDVSQFYLQHPGGFRLIRHYSGQDATDAFTAFHKDKDLVKKYLNFLLIGELAPDQPCCEPTKNEMLVKDFHELHATVEKMGLFKSRFSFFAWMFLHAFILDIASWSTIWYFGKSWTPFLLGVAMFTIGQIQYGFLQHDLGHVSVFEKLKWNKVAHFVVFDILKGGPMGLWNHMHNQHHAKPNCFRKDPDINTHPMFFSLGKKLSLKLGKKKRKYMPYQYQHNYFILLAPLMFIIGTQFLPFRFFLLRRKWLELFTYLFFYFRVCLMYVPLMGFKSFMAYYYLARYIEASWFLWVSQMNHIPMNIDYDQNLDWFSAQLSATCNVDESPFNDWYTGHLNFQIEHHLFPTMPRHNYYKVVPLVKSLCAKHNIKYECKPMLTAFADIVRTLKESGKVWHNAYYQE
ncbi:fatty acid desaturase 1-like isoform X1 [Notechis scutatus]|uniref:Fatty acid desaturase 1-like isoform X1 n=1 Tax=Notechis scutatus TaxID=8663 RepID=A0A6J1V532_9SAUR|nr:fatty acid desaturase 1-like isoform X1 [Notechis scutatus]